MDITHGPKTGSQTNVVDQYRIAVLIPCRNEELTIANVIAGFRASLPRSLIFVYDNNSNDRTAEIARKSGAIVRRELREGKGYVIRRMFSDVDADIYIIVDGDGTYDAPSAPLMIARLIEDQLDMVAAVRVAEGATAYRAGHQLGNRALTTFVATVFGHALGDMLTGYRAFTRRFVKSFPVLSSGFEIETKLTVHALELAMPIGEVPTPYYARPKGSSSKLRTWHDGFRILRTIVQLYKSERPLNFFRRNWRGTRIRRGRTCSSDFYNVSPRRHCSTTPHGGTLDGPDVAGFSFTGMRIYA